MAFSSRNLNPLASCNCLFFRTVKAYFSNSSLLDGLWKFPRSCELLLDIVVQFLISGVVLLVTWSFLGNPLVVYLSSIQFFLWKFYALMSKDDLESKIRITEKEKPQNGFTGRTLLPQRELLSMISKSYTPYSINSTSKPQILGAQKNSNLFILRF